MGMISAACIFISDDIQQMLCERSVTVEQDIYLFREIVLGCIFACVELAADSTSRLVPVIVGAIGIHAGFSVEDAPFSDAADEGAIRVHDVTDRHRLPVIGVLRYVLGRGRCISLTNDVEVCFLLQHSVDVQPIRAVGRGHPFFGRVMVSIILRHQRGTCERRQQHSHGQYQRKDAVKMRGQNFIQ